MYIDVISFCEYTGEIEHITQDAADVARMGGFISTKEFHDIMSTARATIDSLSDVITGIRIYCELGNLVNSPDVKVSKMGAYLTNDIEKLKNRLYIFDLRSYLELTPNLEIIKKKNLIDRAALNKTDNYRLKEVICRASQYCKKDSTASCKDIKEVREYLIKILKGYIEVCAEYPFNSPKGSVTEDIFELFKKAIATVEI